MTISPKQYSTISLKATKKGVETPIFMNNDGVYYLFRSISQNIMTLTAKILTRIAIRSLNKHFSPNQYSNSNINQSVNSSNTPSFGNCDGSY